MTKHIKSIPVGVFRQSAEGINQKKPSKSVSRTDNAQMRQLILDLKTHQIELELQNQELLQAKNQIAAQAEKYAELYDFAPTGYFTLARSGDILELNLSASQMLGQERAFLKDKKFGHYVSDHSVPIFISFLNRVFSNKSKQTCEIVIVTNSGSQFYVSLSGIVAVNSEHCLVSVIDITRHKKAEESLIQMANDWQSTFDASNDMIWLLDKDQRVRRSNKVSEKFCHYSTSELIGKHCWEILHGTSEPIPECPFQKATRSLGRETMDLQLGNEWFEVAVDPVLDATGQYAGAVHIVSNITSRKQVETTLTDTVDQLRKIASRVPGVVYQFLLRPDGSSCFPFASEAIRDIYGVTPEEVREDASKVFANLHPDDYENIVASIQKSAQELTPWQHEYRVKFDDGTVRQLYGNAVPQLQEDGSVLWHGFITDITQRKRLEESVLESERRLRRVNESGMLGMFYWNSEGQITEANNKFLEMVGYSRDDLENGKVDWIHLTPSEFKDKDDNALKELNLSGIISVPYEKEYFRRDNTRLPILLTAATLDEKRLSGVAFIIDLTDRKKAEIELHKSELLYRTLFEKANEGILYLTTDLRIKMVNEAFAQMHGYSVDELLHMSITDLETPVPLQLSYERLADLYNGETIKFEVEHSHRDGHVIPLEVTSNLIYLGGEVIIQAFNRDITERKIAEKTLRESEERYRTIVKASPDNITITDMDGRILMVSPVGLTMFIYNHEVEILGRPITNFIVPQDFERAANNISLMQQGILRGSEEYRGIRKDGSTFDIDVNGQIIKGDDGQPSRIIFIVRDITARKQAEEALHESEVQYRSLFNNFLESVAVHQIVLDDNGNPVDYIFLQANEAFEKQTGLHLEDILGKRVTEVIPGIEKTPFIEIYGKVVLTGESITFEQFSEPLDQYYHINAFRTGEGRFCTIFQDISEKRRVEKVLENQHALLTALINSPNDFTIFSLDRNYCYTTFNEKHRREMKRIWHVDIALGMNLLYCMPVSELRKSAKHSADRALLGESFSQIQHLNEPDIYYEFSWNPIKQNNEIVGVTVFIRDITERKQIEVALKKSEDLFSKAFHGSPSPMTIARQSDGAYVAVNESFANMVGYSSEELIGQTGSNLNLIDTKERDEIRHQMSEKGAIFNIEVQARTKSGRDLYLLTSIQNIELADGACTIATMLDITERKIAEDALRLKNLVFEASIAANSISGLDGIITEANDSFCRIWGYVSRAEVVGKPITNFINDSNDADAIITSLNAKDLWEGDYIALKKDGSLFNAYGLATTIKDEKDNVIGYQSSVIDITERIRIEQALHESESKFRNLIWDMQVGVLLQDSRAKILLCNPKALELLGLSEDQLLGRTSFDPFWNVIHEDGSPFPGSTHPVVVAIEKRCPVRDVVMGVCHSSEGKRVWLLVDAEPQLNKDGTIRQVVCSFIDISLRKQEEEALIQSRNLLSSLARLVPGVIYQYRLYPDGRSSFPYASPGMNDIYEITPEEVQQDATLVFGRLHPDDFEQVVDAIQESARTLNMFHCEFRVNLPRQGLRWRWSQAQPLRMEDGSILWHGIISDITDRKLAEEALHESEQKFRETVINLDEGYFSITLDGVILDHNQAFSRILGFDKSADLKGVRLPDFWQNPELRGEYLSELIANGFVSNFQINAITQKGEKVTVLSNAHIVKDKVNQTSRIDGLFLDVTERIRMEGALRRHAGRLENLHKIDKAILSPVESHEAIIEKALQHIRSLLSSQHASIGIFDFENEALQLFAANIKDGSIAQTEKFMINKVYPELDTLRQNRMNIIEDISIKSSPHELLQVLQSEGIMSCINVPLVSGEKLIGAMNLGWEESRAFTPEELEIASEVADEITIAIEQVRLRQEARQYTEEIEKRVEERTSQLLVANRELEAFSYSVSHDLRAPLRHINGYVSLLTKHLEGKLSEKEKHYLDTIADSARQMGILIDDLLHFSRTGRQEMQLSDLDMNIVVQDALQVIKHDNHDRVIKWKIAALPHVFGDYSLLRLVWLNLLSNAAKFTRANMDTRIEIGVVDDPSEFVFFVSDNGVGFDMQYAHKLFGVFERLHTSQEFEGTGIGLANVRRIIRRHDGRTWAESELDKGATFYFTLPKLDVTVQKNYN